MGALLFAPVQLHDRSFLFICRWRDSLARNTPVYDFARFLFSQTLVSPTPTTNQDGRLKTVLHPASFPAGRTSRLEGTFNPGVLPVNIGRNQPAPFVMLALSEIWCGVADNPSCLP